MSVMHSEGLHFGRRCKTPVILQSEAAECGLACLAMVANHHGLNTDLTHLRRQISISSQGSTLSQLMEFASRLDLLGRPLRAELDSLDQVALPAILHWDFNHFVVLVEIAGGRITLHDPAKGKVTLDLDQASRHFTGVVMEVQPTANFVPRTSRERIKLRQLIGRIPGLGNAVGQILMLALVLELFALLLPWFAQLVLDDAVVAGDRELLSVLGLGFILLVVFKVATEALRGWIVMILSTTMNFQLLSQLFHRLVRLPYGYFEKRHLGDIVSRFDSMSVIQRTLTGSLLEAMIDGVMAISTFIMLLVYSPKLTIVVICGAVLYGMLRLALFLPLRMATEDKISRGALQQSNLLETVRGIQSIKLFNREQYRRAQFQNLAVNHFNADIAMQKLHILYRGANGLIFSIEHIVVIWLGALLIMDQRFSVGMMFAYLAYKDLFSQRVIALIEKGIELKMLGLHTERVADIALSEPELAEQNGVATQTTRVPQASIQVRGLQFAWGDAQAPVLQDLSLDIEAAECVAIVGLSGCGKTTLVKLLLGLLQPDKGTICMGGKDIHTLGIAQYRQWVGSVLQEDQLFAGSIADNISFFDPEADQQRIEECAQCACIHQDIAQMAMGYNTLIGEMGGALSGGQKQRLLLARALYKQPQILILDEATSHLDVQREKQVTEAVRKLNLTRIIIAHRPETIASADRVILLQKGKAQTLSVTSSPSHKVVMEPAE
ncbi:MAG: peptidase domain-containing ABC transporter [Ketobacter sp.]|jgi:ATP-binding cassette, subfamily B, bacterial CvaB/MchF/RaxB|nr:peptidase domain-containing ABC transporter [Ketobacter sp.]|tara:strand:- start:2166 stop:4328 length:2163 start_codon:yes stop_codon:yes gene_type:complete